MRSSNLDAIRRRLAAATSTDWQRLDHYGEAQAEFTLHARADMATLLAALDAAQRQLALADAVVAAWQSPWSDLVQPPAFRADLQTAVLAYRKARSTSAGGHHE